MRWLRTQPMWDSVQPYFQVSQIIQSWMSDLISRLKVGSDLSINIADLFPNATLLTEYIQASLNIDEETALKMVTSLIMSPDKVQELKQHLLIDIY